MENRNCIMCGKEFSPKAPNQICCCQKCGNRRSIVRMNEEAKKPKPKQTKSVKKPKLSIIDIQKLAEQAGMTYGKYVATHAL